MADKILQLQQLGTGKPIAVHRDAIAAIEPDVLHEKGNHCSVLLRSGDAFIARESYETVLMMWRAEQ